MIDHEIRSITGLRAVAALGVYLNHFGNPAWFPNRLSNIQANGGFAVPFFFVLSGFVLALAYDGNTIDARAFYLNRFARIGPTYFVALFIALATFLSSWIAFMAGVQKGLMRLKYQNNTPPIQEEDVWDRHVRNLQEKEQQK